MTAPLEGVRVLDFGKHVAGPWCGALLADLGADVVRVERPGGGDDRFVSPVADDGSGSMYMVCNRGKRDITLRAHDRAARPVIDALIRWTDVIIANLPQATREAMGIDWPQVHRINPRAVLATATCFGEGGPYSGRLGFDGVAQSMSGAVALSGEPGHPTRCYAPYVDFGTGSYLALGTMTALLVRERTGRGQHVDGSLLNTGLITTNRETVERQVRSIDRQPMGNRGQIAAPYDVFTTKDGHVFCSVIGNRQFARWSEMVGRAELADDPRLKSDAARADHGDELGRIMGDWCGTRSNAEVIDELARFDLAVGPVYRPQEVLDDPHVRAIGQLVDLSYPGTPAPAPIADFPVTLSETPGGAQRRAPTLGEHTDDVLAEIGLTAGEIEALRAAGVV
jgi:crotonobetainyl-CoA:carnitine CoA-transferase CaiB-like acyl-CoA transferase